MTSGSDVLHEAATALHAACQEQITEVYYPFMQRQQPSLGTVLTQGSHTSALQADCIAFDGSNWTTILNTTEVTLKLSASSAPKQRGLAVTVAVVAFAVMILM